MPKLSVRNIAALSLIYSAMAIVAQAQTLTTLVNFDGGNGAYPQMSLTQGVDGALYGTTEYGGLDACGQQRCGTAFKVTSGGTLAHLDLNGLDGATPESGLMLATNGNFYGTAFWGGLSNYGTIFEIAKSGEVNTLYNFCAPLSCSDGHQPFAGLIQAADGNFYGTTGYGGGGYCSGGCGTVFKITPKGVLTTLYSFCAQPGCADGYGPVGSLLQAADGSFYGATVYGGSPCEVEGCGTLFKITSGGTLTTLYSFNNTDGSVPNGGLVQATDGNLYGTTSLGGTNSGGTLFRITLQGTLTTLYSFCAQPGCADGSNPSGGLVQAADGNFYGVTSFGGDSPGNGGGTVFQFSAGGILTALHSFDGTDGVSPMGGLVQATSGIFYGTTSQGGNLSCFHHACCGTVFSLSTGLSPFVGFVRNPAKVGQSFGILGQGLAGTTNLSLNGIPATFNVISDTFIRATVPAGASTGYVTVTTPSGTLTSNVPFHVIR